MTTFLVGILANEAMEQLSSDNRYIEKDKIGEELG
jgi:hypothetical protein